MHTRQLIHHSPPLHPPTHLLPPQGLKCCMPYPSKRESVELVAEDLARLDPEEFLNDTCIDFYIK